MVRPPAPPKPALAPFASVKQYLRDALATGRRPPGTLMPSEADLVAQFGVSRMTVNRALRELQAEGLVGRAPGGPARRWPRSSGWPPVPGCSTR